MSSDRFGLSKGPVGYLLALGRIEFPFVSPSQLEAILKELPRDEVSLTKINDLFTIKTFKVVKIFLLLFYRCNLKYVGF